MTRISTDRGNPVVQGPSKEEVLEARDIAGMSQGQAAELTHLGSVARWSEYERGVRNMDAARYELFLIKTNQHPEYGPRGAERPITRPQSTGSKITQATS